MLWGGAAGWEETWPTLFNKILLSPYEGHVRVRGAVPELEEKMPILIDRVIPRLLESLTEGGEPIKPRLVHGDFWIANVSADVKTGQLYIYDPCAYYAHREFELGQMWSHHRFLSTGTYRTEYLKLYPPDEPSDEFDDRSRLYSLYSALQNIAHFPNTAPYKDEVIENVRYLVDKYGN